MEEVDWNVMAGDELKQERNQKPRKLAKVPVQVRYEDGEIANYGGLIEEVNAVSVLNNGMYYTKAICRFYVM